MFGGGGDKRVDYLISPEREVALEYDVSTTKSERGWEPIMAAYQGRDLHNVSNCLQCEQCLQI